MRQCEICKRDEFSENSGKCIFHCEKEDWYIEDKNDPEQQDWSSSQNKVTLFWEEIRKYINDSEGIINFKSFIFPRFEDIDISEGTLGKRLNKSSNFWEKPIYPNILEPKSNPLSFDEGLDFSQAQFLSHVRFNNVTFKGRIVFNGCTFFQDVFFNGARFGEVVYFKGVSSKGDISLYDTKFEKRLEIKNSLLSGDFYLNKSVFSEGANVDMIKNVFEGCFSVSGCEFKDKFESQFDQFHSFSAGSTYSDSTEEITKFNSELLFVETCFGKQNTVEETDHPIHTNFISTEFNGKVKFSRSKFYQNTSFHKANFNNETNFISVEFHDSVNFTSAKFSPDHSTLFHTGKEHHIIFNVSSEEKVKKMFYIKALFCDIFFPETVIFRWVNLENVSFRMSYIECIKFNECNFGEVDDRIILADEKDLKDKPSKIAHNYEEVENIYRQLKKNFDAMKNFETGGDFYIGELEMRREKFKKNLKLKELWKLLLKVKFIEKGKIKIVGFETCIREVGFLWSLGIRWLLLFLFKILSYYGERPSRILGWIILAIFCFAISFKISASLPFGESFELSLKNFFPFLKSNLPKDCYGVVKPIVSRFYNFERVISVVFWFIFVLSVRQKLRR